MHNPPSKILFRNVFDLSEIDVDVPAVGSTDFRTEASEAVRIFYHSGTLADFEYNVAPLVDCHDAIVFVFSFDVVEEEFPQLLDFSRTVIAVTSRLVGQMSRYTVLCLLRIRSEGAKDRILRRLP
ncbi:hypothetical protein Hypma_016037 [Hypsizygus marmoreus]|uniref:Uncharacterized protein n=1 Tax=Hypsizygus marmoreus TaxID=39966 RepID=A0A369K726_HYPMA|nr:hypothetical protein Hypma_016037 [Hypsizygus marmoreus]